MTKICPKLCVNGFQLQATAFNALQSLQQWMNMQLNYIHTLNSLLPYVYLLKLTANWILFTDLKTKQNKNQFGSGLFIIYLFPWLHDDLYNSYYTPNTYSEAYFSNFILACCQNVFRKTLLCPQTSQDIVLNLCICRLCPSWVRTVHKKQSLEPVPDTSKLQP